MSTRTQDRALVKGLKESLTRGKDRQETALVLHHSIDADRLPGLLRQLQSWLPVGVSITAAPVIDEPIEQITRWKAEKKILSKQMAALQAQIDSLHSTPSTESVKWVSLARAAEILHKSYPTLYRAYADGRLVTKPIGGKSRTRVVCDPSTFRAKGRGKNASPSRE